MPKVNPTFMGPSKRIFSRKSGRVQVPKVLAEDPEEVDVKRVALGTHYTQNCIPVPGSVPARHHSPRDKDRDYHSNNYNTILCEVLF